MSCSETFRPGQGLDDFICEHQGGVRGNEEALKRIPTDSPAARYFPLPPITSTLMQVGSPVQELAGWSAFDVQPFSWSFLFFRTLCTRPVPISQDSPQ
jgi:hypothetical protein